MSPIGPINPGGGGGDVSSVFSRTGAVVGETGDYANLYADLVDGSVPIDELPVNTASTIRATSGVPTIETTDQVGDFAWDATAVVLYGPLGGTLTVGEPWTTSPATCPVNDLGGSGNGAVPTPQIGTGTYSTFDRRLCSSSYFAPTSGDLYVSTIWLPEGLTIGHIVFIMGAGATTPAHWWYGLYDNENNQLAVTADQLTAAPSTYDTNSLAIAETASGSETSFTTTYSGWYYLGIMQDAATPATISYYGGGSVPAEQLTQTNGSSDTSQTTPPSFPHKAAYINGINDVPFGYVAP